jgi:hypothetical protein
MKHNRLAFYTVAGGTLPQMTHWMPLPAARPTPGWPPPPEDHREVAAKALLAAACPPPQEEGVAETERRHSADCRQQEAQREREAHALQAGYELGAASPPPSEARGWQDIETAPKDGTVVMVWWPIGDYPSGNHEFASYVDFGGEIPEGTFDGKPYRNGWTNDHGGDYLPVEPTHWMPLPDPPGVSTVPG